MMRAKGKFKITTPKTITKKRIASEMYHFFFPKNTMIKNTKKRIDVKIKILDPVDNPAYMKKTQANPLANLKYHFLAEKA